MYKYINLVDNNTITRQRKQTPFTPIKTNKANHFTKGRRGGAVKGQKLNIHSPKF